jgi:hypothetical protein
MRIVAAGVDVIAAVADPGLPQTASTLAATITMTS